jgi:hypothetical protein
MSTELAASRRLGRMLERCGRPRMAPSTGSWLPSELARVASVSRWVVLKHENGCTLATVGAFVVSVVKSACGEPGAFHGMVRLSKVRGLVPLPRLAMVAIVGFGRNPFKLGVTAAAILTDDIPARTGKAGRAEPKTRSQVMIMLHDLRRSWEERDDHLAKTIEHLERETRIHAVDEGAREALASWLETLRSWKRDVEALLIENREAV